MAKLTNKTLLAFRRTLKYRDFLLQLHGQEYYRDIYSWISDYQETFKDSNDNLDKRSDWIRDFLQYPIHEQLSVKVSSEESYTKWHPTK